MALALKKQPGTASEAAPKVSKKAQAQMDKPFVPILPLVNLLAPEVQEVVEQQRLKRLFLALGVAALAAIAAVWALQAGMIAVAQHKLDDTTAKQAQLTAQQNALAPIQTYYGQVDGYKSTIQTTMKNEVLTSQVLTRLNAITPVGVSLTTVSVTVDAGATPVGGAPVDPTMTTSTCPSQDPYTTAVASAGCVSVDGTADSRATLARWLDAVAASDMFTVAFIPSTTADSEGGEITFSASIGLDGSTVYRNRYADPNFLKAGN